MADVVITTGTVQQVALDLWRVLYDESKHSDPLVFFQQCLKAANGHRLD